MISSMVTWYRPMVNTRPMKLPPPPEPAPPPPTPEPGPELTNSRRESKNFFISPGVIETSPHVAISCQKIQLERPVSVCRGGGDDALAVFDNWMNAAN